MALAVRSTMPRLRQMSFRLVGGVSQRTRSHVASMLGVWLHDMLVVEWRFTLHSAPILG